MTTTQTLLQDAIHESHYRLRGRAERLVRLSLAGVPLDHEGLVAWIAAERCRQLEAAGYLFRAEVIRIKRGAVGQELKVDIALPHTAKVGVTVVSAMPDAIRMEDAEDERIWIARSWRNLGNAVFPSSAGYFADRDEAISAARMAMLAEGWHETRASAVAAGVAEFHADARVAK